MSYSEKDLMMSESGWLRENYEGFDQWYMKGDWRNSEMIGRMNYIEIEGTNWANFVQFDQAKVSHKW